MLYFRGLGILFINAFNFSIMSDFNVDKVLAIYYRLIRISLVSFLIYFQKNTFILLITLETQK